MAKSMAAASSGISKWRSNSSLSGEENKRNQSGVAINMAHALRALTLVY